MSLLSMKQQDHQITAFPLIPVPLLPAETQASCHSGDTSLERVSCPLQHPQRFAGLHCSTWTFALRGMFLSGDVFECDFVRCHSKEGEDYLGVSSSPSWQGRHGGSG